MRLAVEADARPFLFLLIDLNLLPRLKLEITFPPGSARRFSLSALTKCSGAEACVGCGSGDEVAPKLLTSTLLTGGSVFGESFVTMAQIITRRTSSGRNHD